MRKTIYCSYRCRRIGCNNIAKSITQDVLAAGATSDELLAGAEYLLNASTNMTVDTLASILSGGNKTVH